MSIDTAGSAFADIPIDQTSRDHLEAQGLRFDLVDTDDRAQFDPWYQAVARGFHTKRETQAAVDQRHGYLRDRRTSGVWDDGGADAPTPVATVQSWPTDLSVPGNAAVRAWAISDVTVSPTHRRRGLASALLTSELRTALALGIPVAMLTVSEATIYSRFGFGPSASARTMTIDTRRARWTGPVPQGSVQFVTAEQLRTDGAALIERARLLAPGEVEYDGILWDRQLGMMVGDENAAALRFVRYDDADGDPQGFAIFRMVEPEGDFSQHTLILTALVTATDEAYAGLWRFLLEMDLVTTIKAELRAVDEALPWMVADLRAVETRDRDHLWTRILDVPAALAARRYPIAGSIVMRVSDSLGFADGVWTLEAGSDGRGVASSTPDAEPQVTLTVSDLAALYLGGVGATTLARAGRIAGDAAAVDALHALFRWPVAPRLSIWF